MKNRYLFALAVLPVTISGAAFSRARVLGTKADAIEKITYDYSKTDNTGIIGGGDLLKAVKSDQASLPQAEVAYADAHFEVKYDKFPVNKEKFHYGVVDGNMYIEGFDFDGFKADHVNFTLNGVQNSATFDKVNKYQIIATIPEAAENVNVVYKHTFDLDVNAANEILNAAYKVGQKEVEVQNAYDAYKQKLDAYNNYNAELEKFKRYEAAHNEWLIEQENYNNYRTQLAQYQTNLNRYNAYIDELNSYETKLENFKTYQNKLDAYNSNKAAIEAALAEYDKKIKQVDYQLGLMDLFYLGPDAFPGVEAGGTLYSYIYRDAVNQVLNRQSDLSALGVPEIAISKAGQATVALRDLLDTYKSLRTAKNKEEMYKFYIKNFSRVKSNTITLAQCLEKFFLNGAVRTVMEQQGKTQRYIYLIAELIYVAERLSDTPVNCFDKVYGGSLNYTLDHNRVIEGKTVQQILGLTIIPEKTYTSKPLASFPVSVDEVYGKKPEPADFGLTSDNAPIRPQPVEKPVAPQVVAAPGAEPTPAQFGLASADRPTKLDHPGVAPEQRNPEYNSLYELVKNGTLVENNKHSRAVTLTVDETFSLKTSGVDESNIALYVYGTATGEVKIHEVVFVKENESPKYTHDPGLEQGTGNLYKWIQNWKVGEKDFDFNDLFTGSATIQGVFGDEAEIETFEVEWVDEDGSNILGDKFTEAYNIFRPAFYNDFDNRVEIIPCKESTSTTRYEFAGISYTDGNGQSQTVESLYDLPVVKDVDENFKVVNKRIKIVVHFNEIPLVSVKFVNDDVTLFDAGTLEENTRVNYGGATPTKQETDSARYEFIGWAINGNPIQLPYEVKKPAVGNEVEIKAQFRVIQKWNIKFNYGDSKVDSQIVENGKMPVVPTSVDKQFTDNEFFEFTGWDKLVKVASANATYVANYSTNKIIENATIVRDNGLKINVDTGIDEINISKFVELLGEGYKADNTVINFSKGVVELTEANIKQLEAYGVNKIKLVNNVLSDGQREVEVVMLDKNGAPIEKTISLKVLIRSIEDIDHVKVTNSLGNVGFTKVNSNDMRIELAANSKVNIGVYYTISFDEYSKCKYKVNGQLMSLSSTVEFIKGEEVEIEAVANNGTTITKVIVLNPDNTTLAEQEGKSVTFDLAGDVKIYSNSEVSLHTIRIFVDDQIAFEITASYGSQMPLPTPFKRPENGTTYTFEGWKDIEGNKTSIVVDDDIDLVAVFSETKAEEKEGLAQARSYTKLAAEILLIVSVLGFSAGLVIICFKRPKDTDE